MGTSSRNFLYTSQVLLDLTNAEQENSFKDVRFEAIIQERPLKANRPNSAWIELAKLLKKGDTLFIASLSVLNLKLPTLVTNLRKLAQRGVSIQVGNPGFLITASSSDPLPLLLAELDAQAVRYSKAMAKLQPAKTTTGKGRPGKLSVEELPEIRAMMANKHVKVSDITKRFSASRATIYNFLKQHAES